MVNATQACGTGGTQTCGATCQWGTCTGGSCTGPTTQPCGKCGTQARTCTDGTWSDWGACSGEGVCSFGAIQACGTGGTQGCDASCSWSTCYQGVTCTNVQRRWDATNEVCRLEAPTVPYGTGIPAIETIELQMKPYEGDEEGSMSTAGVGIRYTNGGIMPFMFPINAEHTIYKDEYDQDTATRDRATGLVSLDYTGARLFQLSSSPGNPVTCERRVATRCLGTTTLKGCAGSSTVACGACGTMTRTCTQDGWWNDPRAVCSNQGVCTPSSVEACGVQGSRTCSSSCQWSTCVE